MKRLKSETFNSAEKLANFVNEYKIEESQIQQIISKGDFIYAIFYWA